MAEEFKVKVGLELDAAALNSLKSQISEVKADKIKVSLDTSIINKQITNIKSKLTELSKIKVKIGVTENTSATNIQKTINETTKAYSQLLNLQKQIGKFEIKIAGLDKSKHLNEIEILTKELNGLQNSYNQLMVVFGEKLSDKQFGDIQHQATETEKKIELLKAKMLDVKTKVANGISLKLDNGTFENEFDKAKISAEKYKVSIQQLQQAFNNLKNAQISGDNNKIIQSYEKYNIALKKVKNQLDINIRAEKQNAQAEREIARQQAKDMLLSQNAAKLETSKKALSDRMDLWLHNNSAAARQFGAEIKNLQMQLQGVNSSFQVGEISAKFNAITVQAQLADKATKSFKDKLSEKISEYGVYLTAAQAWQLLFQTLSSAARNVYEIDTAMTELKKVTDETNASYERFLGNAGKQSKDIGTTIKDYITSTADFARLGYDFEDAQKLAKVANIYSVVGDDLESIDEATSDVISIMKAFNIEANNSIGIVDKLNNVSNNFAISSGGLGAALKESASSLSVGGNSLDQAIAMITAANEIAQDPSKVGNGIRTISLRIRGMKTELEEAGEDTEGMVESTAKLRAEIKALSGVDIMLDENTFKSTYQIMDEISAKWDELTDKQRAAITEDLAGKNRANIFNALIENFEKAREAFNTSVYSNGSAMEEHAKWMESLEAKTKQFKAAWEDLSLTIMDDSFLKGLVDLGTNFVTGLDDIISQFGLLMPLLTGLTTILSLKNVGRVKMFTLT